MTIYSQINQNRSKTVLLIMFFMAFMTFFFYLMGEYFGDPYSFLIMGLIFSVFSSFFSYFYSDKIVLSMSGAKPATKKEYFDYYTVTENLAIAAGIPMPKLYVINDEAPNAFATGRNPKYAAVAATTGLLNRLERSEIEGVIAHELSHIKNYDILIITIVTVLVGTVAIAADMASRSMFFGGRRDNERNGGGIGAIIFILLLVLMPLISTIIKLAVSRKREYLADASGSLLTRNPDALANALEKIAGDPHRLHRASSATAHLYIANPFKSGSTTRSWFANLFSTHPPIADRIRILREM